MRAVLFDLWNTLVYCPTRSRVEKIIRNSSLEVTYEEFLTGLRTTAFIDSRITFRDYLERLLEENDLEKDDKVLEDAQMIWEDRLSEARLFPETLECLTDLKDDYRLGLISNIDVSGERFFTSNFIELSELFDDIEYSCTVGLAKPDRKIFERALKALGVDACDAWMVGDRACDDVKGALDSKLNPILIDRKDRVFKRDYPVVRSLLEVRQVLEDRS
ncbi:HAD family hydrolase [Candidatus Altiarchaeota archaeon]